MTARSEHVATGPARRLALAEWRVPYGLSGLILAALALLPFLIFWSATTVQQVFYYHDIQYYFYPYRKLVVDQVRAGNLPLWNPYAFSGIPLLGDGQTAIFYPPNWLFFFLPAVVALNYVILTQFSIAGVGMFCWSRGLGLGRMPAVIAALAYMFNGFITTRVVHLSIMSGAALIPLVFWRVDRFQRHPSGKRFALAALAVAAQGLAGHPQVPIYTAAGVALYSLVRALYTRTGGSIGSMRRAMLWLAAIYIAGYGLGAVQLLPWIDFARLSPRAASASFALVAGQSIVETDWLLFLFPYIYGGVKTSLFHPGSPSLGSAIYIWERSAYLGILPLALALVALLSTRWSRDAGGRERRATLVALLAVVVLSALIAGGRDTPLAQIVYHTPVLGRLRAYARAIVLAPFALATLAAFGMQLIVEATREGVSPVWLRRRLHVVAGIIVLLFGLALGLLPWLLRAAGNTGPLALNLNLTRPTAYVPLVLAAATVALLLWWSRGGANRMPALPVALVAVDMILYAAAFNPTLPAADFVETPRSVALLQQDRSLYRTATFVSEEKIEPGIAQSQLAMSWGMVFGIPSINGFNSLQPRRYTDIILGPTAEDVSYGFLGDNNLLQPGNHILSMLNAKYVLVQPQAMVKPGPEYAPLYRDETVTIYRNRSVYPRAHFVWQIHTEMNQEKVYSIVTHPTFDPRTEAVVEAELDPQLVAHLTQGAPPLDDIAPTQPQVEPPPDGEAQAESPPLVALPGIATATAISPSHLRVETQADADRFLVVSEMFMPGWRATVDGRPTPIYRANYLLRGVIVPAGTHSIDFVYRPPSAIAGAALSTLAGLALLGVSLGAGRRPGIGGRIASWGRMLMANRAVRAGAFLVALLLLLLATYRPSRDFFRSVGDIRLYQRYAELVLGTPRELPREYPPLTVGIFVIPQLLSPRSYMLGFTLLAAAAAWLTVLVVDRLGKQGWWLVLYLGLGALGTIFFRFDIFVVLLTLLAFRAGTRRRWTAAQLLLALGVALKLYPVILLPLVVLWQWREERRLPLASIAAGGGGLVLAVASMWLLSPEQLRMMLQYHRDRPLEIESAGASIAWLLGSGRLDFTFGSWNFISPRAPAIITGMTILNVLALLLVYGWYALGRLSPIGAWALILLVSIITSKVFSTQYLLWALPFVVLAIGAAATRARDPLRGERLANARWLWGTVCMATGLIYPVGFMLADPTMVARKVPWGLMALITARNLLWLLVCWLVIRDWGRPGGEPAAAEGDPAPSG